MCREGRLLGSSFVGVAFVVVVFGGGGVGGELLLPH